MFDSMKDREIGVNEVKEKFGVTPDKVIDVQSLAGDSSDNIPGVPGIGVKTAAELINEFGSLSNLLEKAETIKQTKRRQTILENKDKALLSKKLVSLKLDVPVKSKLNEFEVKKIDKKKLINFLRNMEFSKLLQRIQDTDQLDFEIEPEKNLNVKKIKIDRKKYKTIFSKDDLKDLILQANEKKFIIVDVETNSLDIKNAELVGISFCISEGEAFYIPLGHLNKEDSEINKQLSTELVLKEIKNLLESKNIRKVGHNIKFDYRILRKYGIELNYIEDTMLLSYILDSGLHRHGMDLLSELHLDHKTISFKEVAGTGKSQITFDQVHIDKASEYAAEDADITYRLYQLFYERAVKDKILDVYETLEKPMIKILADMEEIGIKVDVNILKDLSKQFEKNIKDLEKKIYILSGEEFNIASTKQLGDILYKKLKIIGTKKTKKGNYATNVNILEDLAFQGHELPKLILDWRQISKLKNTYTDNLVDFINSKTKRIHTSFLLAATNTGRLASSDPNLQNIPIKTSEGKEIRSAFITDKDKILISSDYSQIEMRILADLADVKELKKAFINKEDIHNITASQIFSTSEKSISDEMRRKAKAINFGIIYGISIYGLAKQISVSKEDADIFLKSYFKKFPEIKDYMNETIKFCRLNGYVKTVFGRKCHFPSINDKNHTIKSFQERAAINAPIQGSAADLLRLAMIKIDEKIKSKIIHSKMLLQIHDELVFECEKSEVKNEKKMISEIMSTASIPYHKFSIPLIVGINEGINWSDIH
jgi:DNA polymerase-1